MKDILQVLRDLLKHRTDDLGSYEFVLESWIETAADEIERLRAMLPPVVGTVPADGGIGFVPAASVAAAWSKSCDVTMACEAAGTGNTTSPPVAAPVGINRHAASQSPDAKCGGGEPLDVSRPDNGLAAGGRGHFITAEEREALIVASIELNALGMFETNHSAALRALLERLA